MPFDLTIPEIDSELVPCALCPMRAMGSIVMLLFVIGCASHPEVPLPKVTRFDDNPEARVAFLEAFRQYYLASMAGHPSMPGCTFGEGGAVATARETGGWDGLSAAKKARLQQQQEEVEKMNRDSK